MEKEESILSSMKSHTEQGTLKANTLPAPCAMISEQVLIGAFEKYCKGLIRFCDVAPMIKRPSDYDKALLYLLNSFFVSSAFAAAQCAIFGVEAQGLTYLRLYLKSKFSKKEKNLLNQWKEQS